MMQNVVPPQQHPPIDEITSPLGAQIIEFCESELFPEALQNCEAASSSNCCYEDRTCLSTTTPAAADGNNNLQGLAVDDEAVDDISASIDFSLSPSFSVPHDPGNQEVLPMDNQIQLLGDAPHLYSQDQMQPMPLGPAFPAGVKEPSYNMGSYLSSTPPPLSFDTSWLFYTGNASASGLNDLSQQQLAESRGDNNNNNNNGGLFLPDSLAGVFSCSSGDLQTLSCSSESQHMMNGSPSTTLASEISSLEDPIFKVGKLSAEERKRKISRYLKKRNERNFSKKIKYACRKTLADSRPRVRGRFAKNDELGELARNGAANNHEGDLDDDVDHMFPNSMPHHQLKCVKEDGGMVDTSDLFARISEVNSFKCNYPIQSWI